ncbi:hypothetical protein TREES_T100006784 [Tupaia chinensis]|uniref:Uncharacterized protein n=1 Tax=Tupaia chinensis TaxID=246437 RepID=L9KHH9_TUPCH|nr:hypothetical protein TREES_T100006784 [Tupaia chinensis]
MRICLEHRAYLKIMHIPTLLRENTGSVTSTFRNKCELSQDEPPPTVRDTRRSHSDAAASALEAAPTKAVTRSRDVVRPDLAPERGVTAGWPGSKVPEDPTSSRLRERVKAPAGRTARGARSYR